jgi:hypothetical protein
VQKEGKDERETKSLSRKGMKGKTDTLQTGGDVKLILPACGKNPRLKSPL